jgi:hypothetical protein
LSQRLTKQGFELGGDGFATDRIGLLHGNAADGFFLDELALQRVDRGKVRMTRLETR